MTLGCLSRSLRRSLRRSIRRRSNSTPTPNLAVRVSVQSQPQPQRHSSGPSPQSQSTVPIPVPVRVLVPALVNASAPLTGDPSSIVTHHVPLTSRQSPHMLSQVTSCLSPGLVTVVIPGFQSRISVLVTALAPVPCRSRCHRGRSPCSCTSCSRPQSHSQS